MKTTFLHTNDFHGKLDESIFPQLLKLRSEADFYFDSGDAIRAGNLAIPMSIDPVWSRFAELRCSASVLGNRETHPLRPAFERKIEGHSHPLLAGNMTTKEGKEILPGSMVLQKGDFKIGVISTMVAMATTKMKTAGAWFATWSDPIESTIRHAREMRPRVDLLVALTHMGYSRDRLLAEKCGDIDIIFGGHSHTVLEHPEQVGQTWIVQGGSHGRFAGVYQWDGQTLSGGLVPLTRDASQS